MRSQEYDTLVDKEDAEAERLPTVEESTTEGSTHKFQFGHARRVAVALCGECFNQIHS